MQLKTLTLSTALSLSLFILSGCGKSAQEVEAQQRALDADEAVVSSCVFDAVLPVSISSMSAQETSQICEKMSKTLGRKPSVRLLRRLSKAVSLLQQSGRESDVLGNAYQFMRIAESRGQLGSDDAMMATFEVVFKIVNSMDGRVTARDLNIYLSNLGRGAKTISDGGLIHSAAVLSVMRQDQGG